ncbi:hypothetical protein BgiMline_030595, partial [Biomphalaria glabrata]
CVSLRSSPRLNAKGSNRSRRFIVATAPTTSVPKVFCSLPLRCLFKCRTRRMATSFSGMPPTPANPQKAPTLTPVPCGLYLYRL